METNSTNKLITIAEKKGIKFLRGDKALFKKYSYVQVINAYKNLFAYDEDTRDEIKENIHNQIPLKRMGTAKEVANLIYFLGSDESAYITGQVINIDGGMVM